MDLQGIAPYALIDGAEHFAVKLASHLAICRQNIILRGRPLGSDLSPGKYSNCDLAPCYQFLNIKHTSTISLFAFDWEVFTDVLRLHVASLLQLGIQNGLLPGLRGLRPSVSFWRRTQR